MEQNSNENLEEQKAQELRDLIWFGQGVILGELENADPAKAESNPSFIRKTALDLTILMKEFIDEQAKELEDKSGANEVFISSIQTLGRKVNGDYMKVINNPMPAIRHVYNQAILSIVEIEERLKKERELTEA